VEEGYYIAVLTTTSGAVCEVKLAVADEYILGEGNSLSFLGDILDSSMILNVWRGHSPLPSPFLGHHLTKTYSGFLTETDTGYKFHIDNDCASKVTISFERFKREGKKNERRDL